MGAASVAVVGPTACGKTRCAVEIARHLNGEIISADSRQIYRDMTIGTGKDLAEYGEVPYHLIDIRDAGTKYNLHEYLRDFSSAYYDILNRDRTPVICGGSGMYVENALAGVVLPEVPANIDLRRELASCSLEQLTEKLKSYKTLHNNTDTDTVQRAIRAIEIQEYYLSHPEDAERADVSRSQPLDCVIIGLDISREDRRARITQRLHSRLDDGMVEEVRALLANGIDPKDLIYYGLEYKFVTLYLIGSLSYKQMVHDLEIAIHQFAKRQMTWFRGMEKRGFKINWLPYDVSVNTLHQEVDRLMSN